MEINKTTLGIAAGVAGTLFLGYCIYFDHKRRSDPDYKKKIRDSKYISTPSSPIPTPSGYIRACSEPGKKPSVQIPLQWLILWVQNHRLMRNIFGAIFLSGRRKAKKAAAGNRPEIPNLLDKDAVQRWDFFPQIVSIGQGKVLEPNFPSRGSTWRDFCAHLAVSCAFLTKHREMIRKPTWGIF